MLYKTTAALCILVAQTFAANAADGTITFDGALITDGCKFVGDSSSTNKTVPMGTYNVTALSKTGDSTPKKPVALTFEGCPSEFADINVGFSGSLNSNNPEFFEVKQGTNSIDGIGLSLTTEDNKALPPNTGVQISPDEDGNASLTVQANYIATANNTLTAGELASVVNVSISYE